MRVELHTLQFGKAPWITECSATLKEWCKRHGYAYTKWGKPKKQPTPKLVIFEMLEYFLKGPNDYFIYADADLWFNAQAPKFPHGDGITVMSDAHHQVHNDHFREWVSENYKTQIPEWNYVNAGFWGADRNSAENLLKAMRQTKFREFFQEQHWFNLCVQRSGAPITDLPVIWNRFGKDCEAAWVYHLWGDTKDADLATLKQMGLTTTLPISGKKSPTADNLIRSIRHPNEDPNRIIVTEFIQDCGLGNQMFEWAAGYSLSRATNAPFRWIWKPSNLREFELTNFGIGEGKPCEYTLAMKRMGQGNRRLYEVAKRRILESQTRMVGISCPFQDEQCFIDHADEIAERFTTEPVEFDIPAGTVPVGVQVRRGDYLKHARLNVTTPDYFTNAMRWMKERIPSAHFIVVSDDPEWCGKFFGYRDDTTVMPSQSSYAGICTLASCHGHIISNSTFGWWGAWLGERRHGGPVVVPELWHNAGRSYGDWNPVPDRWNRVGLGFRKKVAEIEPQAPILAKSLPDHPRAIIYPYHADKEVWHELRYSLRSVHRFFEDKECPIYILGTKKPGWLIESHRVKYIGAYTYREALSKGVQIGEEVLWMNDDIALLKPTTWEDCRTTLYLKDVAPDFLERAQVQSNPWREGCLRVMKALWAEGIREQKVYSTHTPYVYQRVEALEIFEKYGLWEKFPMELAYFHHHAVRPELVGSRKVEGLPFGDAQFLGYSDRTLTDALKRALTEMFPELPPWELDVQYCL